MIPFKLAGASIGMGVLGEAFDSEGLKQGATAAGKVIPVAIDIQMGSKLIKQLKEMTNGKEKK
jgi:hypothetical protein